MIDVPTMGGQTMDDYLSTRETAQRLGVPRSTVMGWIYRRRLAARRRGRWYFVHVDEISRMEDVLRLKAVTA